MPVTTKWHVEGLSELGRRMATLKSDVALKMAPRATGKAAGIVKKEAKSNLRRSSYDTGTLEKNVIAKKLSKNQTDLTAEYIVTVKKAVYTSNSDGGQRHTRRVGVFKEFDVEHGTVTTPAEPFLRPALDQNLGRAVDAIADSLTADLAKAGA